MSVILKQFPDPVMKKHKTPPYTQQDYNAVNYMNGTISASDSISTRISCDPRTNTNYCFGHGSDIYQSQGSVNLAGTKIHFDKVSAFLNIEWTGEVIVRDASTHKRLRVYSPTGYQLEFSWAYGSKSSSFTGQSIFMYSKTNTSETSDSIAKISMNLGCLVNGQDDFTLCVDISRLWIYVNNTITKASGETFTSSVRMFVRSVTCNFSIDYVILSTGEKIYKGQTIK